MISSTTALIVPFLMPNTVRKGIKAASLVVGGDGTSRLNVDVHRTGGRALSTGPRDRPDRKGSRSRRTPGSRPPRRTRRAPPWPGTSAVFPPARPSPRTSGSQHRGAARALGTEQVGDQINGARGDDQPTRAGELAGSRERVAGVADHL